MTQVARNPYVHMIDESKKIKETIATICDNHKLAMEAQTEAYQKKVAAAAEYSDEEAIQIFEVTLMDEYVATKLAGDKKLFLDAQLAKARREGGKLYALWQAKLRAEDDYQEKQMAYKQSEADFKAVCAVADLQSNALRNACIGW